MPPVDRTPHVNTDPFELVKCVHSFNKVPIFEYKSKQTGLTVIIAEIEGPIVNGFFTLATEAFDDDGLPHTLEHLIFLGSEQYPYKGVLDLLANRCFASGTNAWTDTDHTCYTMETAGSEGFLALMPIYLEHILFPTLTEEGFITEVHHVTAEGEDAGVVYCEMQARENSGESKMYLNMCRSIYPGHCGYSSETGGIMKNLRESTNNEKVRNFHKQFYRPENLKIIIAGQIKHEDVFHALEPLEQNILTKGERGPFVRPWQSPVPPLTENKNLTVKYPADEEKNGIFCIAWRGPSAVNQLYELKAISVFLKYLTEFGTSVLPKEFVEVADPYASKIVSSFIENSESCLYLMFKDVPLDKIEQIKPKLDGLLEKIANSEDINMERIQNLLKRNKSELLRSMENDPQHTLAFMIIGYILYGNTKEDLQKRVDPLEYLDRLMKEPKSFWVNLLKKYLIENHYVAIQCIPSKEEQKKMEEEEKQRIKAQKEKFGENGLKELGEKLKKAIEFNERKPPTEMLTSVPIPDLKSINFYNIKRFRTDLDEDRQQIDLSQTPVFTCFDHVKSEFVYIYAFLDTTDISEELRIYLPLYLECVFDCPIKKNGKIIPYEEVIDTLNNDTVAFMSSLGLGSGALFKVGPYSQHICIMIQVEAEKYELGLNWMHDVLFNVLFDLERLKIIITKMINSASQTKRNGPTMVDYAMKSLKYMENSNALNNGVLRQLKFLEKTLMTLNSEIDGQIIGVNLEKCKDSLTQPKNIVLHLLGNLDYLKNPLEQLMKFLPNGLMPEQRKLSVIPDYKLLKSPKLSQNGCIIGMGCLESSVFCQTIECINDVEHCDLPILMLFLQYIVQFEGPMWKQVRGKGYSYSFRIYIKPNEGLLYLVFNKATNVLGAYTVTKDIIMDLLLKKNWDENLIESAKSSMVFELIDEEKTIKNVVSLSVKSYFQGVDYKYNRTLLNRINSVKVEDLNGIGEKYIRPLFDPLHVKTAIVTVPAKVNDLSEAFKSFNLELNTYPSLEESFLNENRIL